MVSQNNPVSITFDDGTVKKVIFDSIQVSEDGKVLITGHLSDEEVKTSVREQNCPQTADNNKQRIRSYIHKSALVRFMYQDRLHTAAVSHCTDKAWRLINKDLGVTWIPKNILKWSEIVQQFCVIDETYKMNFTFDVKDNMAEYPVIFNPESLINEL